MNPRKSTPLPLAALEDTNVGELKELRKLTANKNTTSSALLAKAVQQGAIEEKQLHPNKGAMELISPTTLHANGLANCVSHFDRDHLRA